MERIGGAGGDVRWAIRSLTRRPRFAVAAVATLALGMGAVCAVLALAGAHFLSPLPYERPGSLVLIWERSRRTGELMTVSPGNYFAWKEEAGSLEGLAAFNVDEATLSGDGPPERVRGSVVTPDFFDVLGVRPALGAAFTAEEARRASGDLVVVSHGLWVRRFGADPAAVGGEVRVDGRPHTVVGVLPPSFRQPERSLSWQRAEIWRPLLLDGERDDFRSRYLRTAARLRGGTSLERARAEMDGLSERLTAAHPEENDGWSASLHRADDYLRGDARPVLLTLLAAGVVVLLIVCANVANLSLARGEERRREFAVRAALGSGRARLFRQIVVEGVVLAAAGSAVGLVAVGLARGALGSLQERFLSGLVDVSIDLRLAALTTVAAFAAGALVSIPLARAASGIEPGRALVEGGERSGAGRRAERTRDALVVGQVALATALFAVAALLARSFTALVSVAPGFEPEGRVSFDVSPPRARYPDREALVAYFRDVERVVRSVPGVEAVTMVSDLPFTSENRWTDVRLEGLPADEAGVAPVEYHTTLPDYFDVMGIPVRAGRVWSERWEPVEGAVPVAVNQRLARTVTGGEREALGARLFRIRDDPPLPLRVVAVVGDVLDDGYDAVSEPILYLPYGAGPQRRMAVVARVRGDVGSFLEPLREAVAGVDPDVPAASLTALDDLLAGTAARPRAAALLGGAAALLALLVAMAGIYGVLGFAVESRTREIGIRGALGATGDELIRMVLGRALRAVGAGLALGTLAALVGSRALSGLLFGVGSSDPASFALAVLALGGAGTLAAWLPARRAARVDPADALRYE